MRNMSEPNIPVPKILIGDDDPWIVRVLTERCTAMGFDVETAANGLQALIKASEHRPDILLIDVHMPEVDGFSVCSHLSDPALKSLHLVVMTGHASPEVAERCEELDARYIRKGRNFWREFERALAAISVIDAAAIGNETGQSPSAANRARARVLLVDDDIHVRRFLSSRLERCGVEALCAADGTMGFWKARREEPSVIVCDYFMRNGDAEYLLGRLRNAPETINTPVIVQSGFWLNPLLKHRLQRQFHGQPGAARILEKKRDAAELLDVVKRFCGFATEPLGVLD